ncbi:peptidoglycan-binding protein [Kitasatospora purpeofusca]|uniref:peptidoglycan-binding protein n=1 Tax=Kitasatospora purpeofusca TaxID=67352 RepID=UPI002259A03D|nr:peptidoglycan-binding protein [Kitasatospora purpeofusca]MCX4686756.1 peptidoglycan-binding protein [Kitasatospora purpeofusca]
MRDEFVALLISQEGYHEGRDSDGSWNNMQQFSPAVPGLEWSQGQAWCATFTAWGATRSGMADRWPITASCWTAVQWWKAVGRWTDYPVLGAPFYMGSSGQDHVGVVVAYDQDYIWTIEGNTNASGSPQGDGVYARQRPRRGAGSPYGYGVPDYPEGTISADPALGGVLTARVGTPQIATPPAEPPAAVPARYRTTINGLEYGYGAHGPQVREVGEALVRQGFGRHYAVGPDEDWRDPDTLNYQEYQRSLGYTGGDADGVPGIVTLQLLLGRIPGQPTVSLAHIISAARTDPGAAQGHQTYGTEVRIVEQALTDEGFLDPVWADGSFGTRTIAAYAAFQRHLGYAGAAADGIPGCASLERLSVGRFTLVD